MRTKVHAITSVALAASSLALAQTQSPAPAAAKAPPPAPSGTEKLINDIKKPTSWFTWGGDLRLRNEYHNNAVTLNQDVLRHDQDLFRFRGRLWASVAPITDVSLNARLAAEPRNWVNPAFSGTYRGETGMEWRYGIFDNLNAKWDNVVKQPLSLTVGRQDIQFGDPGDWWLVADGTPADGSWTFFLDSARATFNAKEIQTKFDLVYIYQNPEADAWMPTLGDADRFVPAVGTTVPYTLTDQREQGVVLYGSTKSIEKTTLDGYFIYKHDDRLSFLGTGDNANIYTLGARIAGAPAENWTYSAEAAYQFGEKEDAIGTQTAPRSERAWRDIGAYGGKARLTYLLKDKMDNQFSLVAEYLSGDKPGSGKDEMFDVLWGRWPRWSELYILGTINETGGRIAQMNNLFRVGPRWSIVPAKNVKFELLYNALFAPESTPTRAVSPALFSYDGNFRGHYLQAVLRYQLCKYASAHLWAEGQWQGNFYTQSDLISFLRAEVMFTF